MDGEGGRGRGRGAAGGGDDPPPPLGGLTDAAVREMIGAFSTMGLSLNFHALTANISFSGQRRNYKKWIQNLDRIVSTCRVPATERSNVYKQLAWQTARGSVADVINRRATSHPDESWDNLQEELKSRFGPTLGTTHAMNLLQQIKQKPGDSVQAFAEKILDLAADAYPEDDLNDGLIQRTLANVFMTNLYNRDMAKKVIRSEKKTLTECIAVAVKEQTQLEDFDDRFGEHNLAPEKSTPRSSAHAEWQDPRHEPMEVDSILNAGNVKCYGCFKYGHFRQNCPNKNIQCHKCRQFGHFKPECPNAEVLVSEYDYSSRGVNRISRGRNGSRGRGRSCGNYQSPGYQQQQHYGNRGSNGGPQRSQSRGSQPRGNQRGRGGNQGYGGRGQRTGRRRGRRGRGHQGISSISTMNQQYNEEYPEGAA